MAPPKQPRNAVYKDSLVAYLSHFAWSDSHPTDRNGLALGKLMLHHAPIAASLEREYYHACVLFARFNVSEMHRNIYTVDLMLKASGTNEYSGEYLWKTASETKRILLNDIRCKKHMRYMLSLNACSRIHEILWTLIRSWNIERNCSNYASRDCRASLKGLVILLFKKKPLWSYCPHCSAQQQFMKTSIFTK